MDLAVSSLNLITKGRSDWVIKVMLARRWTIPPNNGYKIAPSFEMVFVDSTGVRVQASAKNTLIKKFEKTLKEGRIYYISNFSVLDNRGKFKITTHPYKILFSSATHAITIGDKYFEQSIYNIRPLREVLALPNCDEAGLIDVAGRVVSKSVLRHLENGKSQDAKYIDVELEDSEGSVIKCTLWGEHAEEMLQLTQTVDGPLVVILQLCRPKIYQGGMYLSNAFYGTKIVVCPKIPEIANLKRMIGGEGSSSNSIADIVASSWAGDLENLRNGSVDVLTVAGIISQTAVGFYWMVGQISEILADGPGSWCFESCRICRRKLTNGLVNFNCEHCSKIESNPLVRYRVRVNLISGESCATFMLWDQACEALVGKTAIQLKEHIVKLGQTVERCPLELHALQGLSALFKINVKEDNISGSDKIYSVSRVCIEEKLISKYASVGILGKRKRDVLAEIKAAGDEVIEISDSDSDNEENDSEIFSRKGKELVPKDSAANLLVGDFGVKYKDPAPKELVKVKEEKM